MRNKKNKFLISPSDLNNFISCKYITKNNIRFLNKEIEKKDSTMKVTLHVYVLKDVLLSKEQ